MNKNLRNKILFILAISVACVYFSFPLNKRINLGLDLKGGMHLILQVETQTLDKNAGSDAVLRAIEILRNRIDSLGVGETVIQRQGENEILVQLPGVTDRETAIAMVGKVAQLEFRLVNDNPEDLKVSLEGNVPAGYLLKYVKEDNEPVLLEDKVALSGETVADANVDFDQMGVSYIRLKFNAQGSKQFGLLTQKNIGRQLAIILDGEVLSAPTIQDAIYGEGQITGQFTFDEASFLALALRSGALPAPMHIEEERTIGPLLGKDSINAGINATIIGGTVVFLFMLVYYLKAGIITGLALVLNLLLIFGTMGFLNVMLPESQLILTLPGIAGIVLTLGMAVDANILINERIREEIQNGRPVQAAIKSGFDRALKAIIDSNITTLIAAFMLFQFGSGPIKGFAVTLSLGLLTSLFTALFVSKTLFQFFLHVKWIKSSLSMLRFFGETHINFMAPRYICFTISVLIIIASIVNLIQKKENAYGIDFAGGQIQEYKFDHPVSADTLRQAFKTVGLDSAVIQQFELYPENIIVRTSEDTHEKVKDVLQNTFPDNPFDILRIERVGPVVGKALRKAAILAIVFALAGILIYVGFRFKHFDFATAGVIALLHDVLVALGVVVMMNRQIDLLVVTALLTIAGYSINDTIIIYDRVRENLVHFKKQNLAEIINLSINQTLGRTILTTLATLLAVVALYVLGGEVLNTFALCLIIGFITGTYSTVFIVSPLVLAWQKSGTG